MAFFKALTIALLAFTTTITAQAAPALPLSTSSRWILDSTGARVKLRCVNWAGHMETHLPEGLHRAPLASITAFIAGAGFNCVRLTYSTDWALNPLEPAATAFTSAAALAGVPEHQAALQTMYDAAAALNPSLANATVRDIYGDVIASLWDHGVMTILDNHVSRASWCCNLTDGNGWWDTAAGYLSSNSRFFNTSEWLDGLQAVAEWSATQPGVVGLSLRNELRQSGVQALNGPYDDWYTYITQGAQRVHAANPDALVVVGGGLSATDLGVVRVRKALDVSGWAGKHVWEMHAYAFTVTFKPGFGVCALVKELYGGFDGFVLEEGEAYTAPLILSEFGASMTGAEGGAAGLSADDQNYLDCVREYMEGNDADWALWAVQGSYYIRNGVLDYNETWGVLDFEWKDWRNPGFSALLGGMWNVTQGP